MSTKESKVSISRTQPCSPGLRLRSDIPHGKQKISTTRIYLPDGSRNMSGTSKYVASNNLDNNAFLVTDDITEVVNKGDNVVFYSPNHVGSETPGGTIGTVSKLVSMGAIVHFVKPSLKSGSLIFYPDDNHSEQYRKLVMLTAFTELSYE